MQLDVTCFIQVNCEFVSWLTSPTTFDEQQNRSNPRTHGATNRSTMINSVSFRAEGAQRTRGLIKLIGWERRGALDDDYSDCRR
jgi:hypothetical protein